MYDFMTLFCKWLEDLQLPCARGLLDTLAHPIWTTPFILDTSAHRQARVYGFGSRRFRGLGLAGEGILGFRIPASDLVAEPILGH